MTKQEIENQLWKIKVGHTANDDYDLDEAIKKAFNLGLEVAANNIEGYFEGPGDIEGNLWVKIDKESILEFKL